MKALLINPPTGLYVREDRCQSAVGDFAVSVARPPMDLMMMATRLESEGIACKIKDYPIEGGEWGMFKKDFSDFKPDLLVISITTPTLKNDIFACRYAKEINPKVLTIAKGAHFLINDLETLEAFKDLDVVIRGENEQVIKEIAAAGDLSGISGISYRDNGQAKRNKDRPLLENLDALPLPARHLVRNELYTRPDTGDPMAVIETSRGCPAGCIFCLVGIVAGKKIRVRSPEKIIDEIKNCITNYNIRNFHFKSDTFTWNKQWLLELCQEIVKQKLRIRWICNSRVDTLDRDRITWMKKAGCWAVGLGVEHGNQEILDKIKKGVTLGDSKKAVALCREFGIKAYTYFIIGFPWDTEETIKDSIRFALALGGDFVDFFSPYPFPGTELERIAKEKHLFREAMAEHAYSRPVIDTLHISHEKVLQLRNSALRQFYCRPTYIARMLFTCSSPKVFLNYLYHGTKILKTVF